MPRRKKGSEPSQGSTAGSAASTTKRSRKTKAAAPPSTAGPVPPPGFEALDAYLQGREDRMAARLDALVDARLTAALAGSPGSTPHPPAVTQGPSDTSPTSLDIQGTGITLGQVMQPEALPRPPTGSPPATSSSSSIAGNAAPLNLPPNVVGLASHPFPLDARVPAKLRAKIIAREFIDFGHLINPSKLNRSKMEVEEDDDGTYTLFRRAGPEGFTQSLKSLTEWDTAFAIYTTVYAAAHPQDVPGLIKFGERVKRIGRKGGDWQHYDVNFRVLLQVDPTLSWSFHHSEL